MSIQPKPYKLNRSQNRKYRKQGLSYMIQSDNYQIAEVNNQRSRERIYHSGESDENRSELIRKGWKIHQI